MSPTVRNIGIVVALAALVALVPGGGTGAGIVSEVLFVAFITGIALLLARFYRENRSTIFGLGDQHRALLYAALALLVFCAAAAGRFFGSGVGILAWLALVGAAVFALVRVWRQYREYA